MNTVREELCLFDDQFRMILQVREEYHQLIEYKVKQEEDEGWFDKLGENVYTFNLQTQGAQLIQTRGRVT